MLKTFELVCTLAEDFTPGALFQMNLHFGLFQLFVFLATASVETSHQPFHDFVAISSPIFLSKYHPQISSTLNGFYKMLDETVAKGFQDIEKARIYRSVDAPSLWKLLCKENESLEKHYHELQKLLEIVNMYVKGSNKFLLMDLELFSYLGCYLRSLIFGTNVLIKSVQSLSLTVLNEARRANIMESYLNVPPNLFYMEHLREVIFVYSKLRNRDAVAGECILKDGLGFFPDMRTRFFYYCPDRALLNKAYYTSMSGEPPKFIKDFIHPEKDLIEIEDKKIIIFTSQAYLAYKYWHILTSYVSIDVVKQNYFDDNLNFTQNMAKLALGINKLNLSWLMHGKCLNHMQRKELRNLCCTFDFLYNYNQLLGAKHDFAPHRKTLLSIIKESRLI